MARGFFFFYFFREGGPVGHEPILYIGWVGPKVTSTTSGCVRHYAWEYVGILLDLLYVVYAEITYNQRLTDREPTGRATWRAVNCF